MIVSGRKFIAAWLLAGSLSAAGPIGYAADPAVSPSSAHRTISATVVAEQSGLLTVKTEEGSQLSLAANASRRHGHAVPKVGEQVTLVVDENNQVIDMHPKGEEGTHTFVTGKLKYAGKMKKELRLETPAGERTFPLDRLEMKAGGIEEGALVTAELNEAGTVIDLHRADSPTRTR